MKCRENDRELSQIVQRHVTEYLEKTNVTRNAFARKVMAFGVFGEEPPLANEWTAKDSAVCKKVERVMKSDQAFPADLIGPFIHSMEGEHKSACLDEVCGMFGSYFTPLHPVSGVSDSREMQARISDLAKYFGDVLNHAGPSIDGKYDNQDDLEELQNLADKIHMLVTKGLVELNSIHEARGVMPRAHAALSHLLSRKR